MWSVVFAVIVLVSVLGLAIALNGRAGAGRPFLWLGAGAIALDAVVVAIWTAVMPWLLEQGVARFGGITVLVTGVRTALQLAGFILMMAGAARGRVRAPSPASVVPPVSQPGRPSPWRPEGATQQAFGPAPLGAAQQPMGTAQQPYGPAQPNGSAQQYGTQPPRAQQPHPPAAWPPPPQ